MFADFDTAMDIALITIGEHILTLGQLLAVLLTLIVGTLIVRIVGRLITKRLITKKFDADLAHLIRRLFYIVAIAVLTITSLELLNVPLTAFAFVSGAIAIGFGFGAQNIINNFISGWILMWERPIKIGDFLEVGETKGTVESIDTRSTRIRRTDGVHLLVPNSFLLENTVVNWTLMDNKTRGIVRVGVAYGSPVRKVEKLIYQAMEEQDGILTDPGCNVIFEDFGDSALIFDAYFWINAVGDRDLRSTRSDLRFRIDELFAENEIVIAFPQRDVHIDGTVEVRQASKPHTP